nr:flagellar motor switch protein FliG [Cryobacterium frigoriphilum]
MNDVPQTLNGAQKVAVVLMNMNSLQATDVMKQFTDAEAEVITAELIQLNKVDAELAESILMEFQEISRRGGRHSQGGHDFARGLLESSYGSDRAAGVMARVASSLAGKAFEFLDSSDAPAVINLLEGELPQTVALVLAHLSRERASAVLSGMSDPLRTDVALCIATMGSASPEAIRIVTDTLKLRVGASVSRDPIEVVGGVQPLVEIINRADAATERALLEGLDARDPALADEVRSHMLTFTDIVRLESRDVQQVLRGIDASILATAMKGTSSAVVEVIRANLSERNRDILDDETKSLGPVRVRQVEDARAEIVRAIRDLEAQGSITIGRGAEDEYVN